MKIKINTHGNPLPQAYGDWIDLATAEEETFYPGKFKIISLGVSMELPAGYYAEVVPRSSTFKNWGILMTNSIGIIDNDYCGDDDIWGFPAYATCNITIPKGTRIAQFRLVKKGEPIEWDDVESLGNENRGGFGSTGAFAAHIERRFKGEV